MIKNTVIASPRAIVPAADPTQLGMTDDMRRQGYYITTGTGPDLMENAKNAVRDMIDWLVTDQDLSLHEAYTLCSGRRRSQDQRDGGPAELAGLHDVPPRHLRLTAPWCAPGGGQRTGLARLRKAESGQAGIRASGIQASRIRASYAP